MMTATERLAESIHAEKHRQPGESFKESCTRIAQPLCDSKEHFYAFRQTLLDRFFLPGGRVQYSVGSPQDTTAVNCFVSGTIQDSMGGIISSVGEAAETMRKGGGDGFDFSTIRPRGSVITTLGAKSSGAVSFMQIYDAMVGTVKSAGDRRGAAMGILRVDHPDIEEFIDSKQNTTNLTNFNLSVAVTDEFMFAVTEDKMFELKFNGIVYKQVRARALWDKLMRSTWDWAEPGVVFIDTINEQNNLYYCEDIAATNPCGEQPLPPHGACILGSFNLTQYDYGRLRRDMKHVVRAMDNLIDYTAFPLPEQRAEAQSKRRMGLGVTGLANYIERAYSCRYGDDRFLKYTEEIMKELVISAYQASIDLAKEKGAFPLFDAEEYCDSLFINNILPESMIEDIHKYGIRNSHLISFAPAGTISITAGNVSSGIEPVFSHSYNRSVLQEDNTSVVATIKDFNYDKYEFKGRTAGECSIKNHLDVFLLASKYSDSAVSKTVNVGSDVTWEEFKRIYMTAWENGAKGCTTFRMDGKRYGVLNETPSDGAACYIDSTTGVKSCS